jgi:hypothetical protein
MKLPSVLQSALDNACDTYYQEQLKNSSMLLNVWSTEEFISSALSKPVLGSKGNKKVMEEVLTIEKFILTLGTVAMQVR